MPHNLHLFCYRSFTERQLLQNLVVTSGVEMISIKYVFINNVSLFHPLKIYAKTRRGVANHRIILYAIFSLFSNCSFCVLKEDETGCMVNLRGTAGDLIGQ